MRRKTDARSTLKAAGRFALLLVPLLAALGLALLPVVAAHQHVNRTQACAAASIKLTFADAAHLQGCR